MALAVSTLALGMLSQQLPLDVMLSLQLLPNGAAQLRYDGRRVAAETAERLGARLGACAAAQPHSALVDAPLMHAAELRFVTIGCNRTATTGGPHETVHAAFASAAAVTPTVVALHATADREELTYAALDAHSSTLAGAMLCALTLRPDRRLVALLFERSHVMVVAIIGVLKAGLGYLPLEPAYPAARIAGILAEATPAAALLQSPTGDELSVLGGSGASGANAVIHAASGSGAFGVFFTSADGMLVPTDKATAAVTSPPGALPAGLHATGSDVAYVMYTSGSTGRPKGVVVTHGPLLKRLYWMRRTLPIGAGDTVCICASNAMTVGLCPSCERLCLPRLLLRDSLRACDFRCHSRRSTSLASPSGSSSTPLPPARRS